MNSIVLLIYLFAERFLGLGQLITVSWTERILIEWKVSKEKYHLVVIDTKTNAIVCCQLGITAFPLMIHALQRKNRTIVPRTHLPS